MRAAFRQWELGARGKLGFQFNAYMLQLAVPVYDALGWDVTENDWDKNILRASILKRVCDLEHKPCLDMAHRKLTAFLRSCTDMDQGPSTCKSLHPDIQETTFCGGVRANSTLWQSLFTLYMVESRPRPHTPFAGRLLAGLVCTKQPLQLRQLVNYAVSEMESEDDRTDILLALGSQTSLSDALWSYVKQAQSQLGTHPMTPALLSTMADRWTDERHVQRLQALADNENMAPHAQLLQDLQERVREQQRVADTQHIMLDEYLRSERLVAP